MLVCQKLAKVHNTRLAIDRLAELQRIFMKHIFNVQGMTCEHCEKAVSRAIRQLDRAAVVEIDRASNRVAVDSEQSPEALKQAIVEEGYSVAN